MFHFGKHGDSQRSILFLPVCAELVVVCGILKQCCKAFSNELCGHASRGNIGNSLLSLLSPEHLDTS